MIFSYTSMGGSQVVHIDAFILEFIALPSLLFVQVSAFALRVSGTHVFSVKCDPVVLHPC